MIIELDDIVKLKEDSKLFNKWKNFTFRVIEPLTESNNKIARIVRNMRNENVGTTNHYLRVEHDLLEIVKKNKNYIKDEEIRISTSNALRALGL